MSITLLKGDGQAESNIRASRTQDADMEVSEKVREQASRGWSGSAEIQGLEQLEGTTRVRTSAGTYIFFSDLHTTAHWDEVTGGCLSLH